MPHPPACGWLRIPVFVRIMDWMRTEAMTVAGTCRTMPTAMVPLACETDFTANRPMTRIVQACPHMSASSNNADQWGSMDTTSVGDHGLATDAPRCEQCCRHAWLISGLIFETCGRIVQPDSSAVHIWFAMKRTIPNQTANGANL